jgi:hypothetical protein
VDGSHSPEAFPVQTPCRSLPRRSERRETRTSSVNQSTGWGSPDLSLTRAGRVRSPRCGPIPTAVPNRGKRYTCHGDWELGLLSTHLLPGAPRSLAHGLP